MSDSFKYTIDKKISLGSQLDGTTRVKLGYVGSSMFRNEICKNDLVKFVMESNNCYAFSR